MVSIIVSIIALNLLFVHDLVTFNRHIHALAADGAPILAFRHPRLTKLLHDAFNRALDDPEYDKLLKCLDMVDWYKSSEDYAEWAVDQFRFQRALIERTIGLGRN